MYDIFIMDMGGHEVNVQTLRSQFPHARVVRYYDNHLDTIRRCIARARTPFAWVISSCCDYTTFDFDYHAAPWEAYQIHCWASGEEKFGDTFLISVAEFLKQQNIELLEWYKDINWHTDGVMRLPWPLLTGNNENLTENIANARFDAPYVWINDSVKFDAPLWRNRIFYTFTDSGSVSLAPREIQGSLDTQIYDYPYISKQKTPHLDDKSLDIIYISNGEKQAEQWYEHLSAACGRAVTRVQNVNGRDQAIKAAARSSTTPWFFAVPAKLEVNADFDWAWQPDWLQEPKHYIFQAENPVTGLKYGHMAMVAYNKELVLATDQHGLDFTMSKLHAVVPLLSGTAHYNSDPLMTWRTAFRECIKLKDDAEKTGSVESRYRLDIWLTTAEGDHAGFSLSGARDALDYYNKVNGDYTELMRSFDWLWLQYYFDSIYAKV